MRCCPSSRRRSTADVPEALPCRARPPDTCAERASAGQIDTTGESVQIKSIGVIGVGTMGAGIMQVAAATGLEVVGVERNDADVEAARQRLEAGFARTAARGKITEAQAAEALGRVTIATELDAVARTDLVVDAVYEDVALKCELLAEIDKL